MAELGCGPGHGTKLILDAVDLNARWVAKSHRRLARHDGRVDLARSSATDLAIAFTPVGDGKDASYAAVLDCAIIHHIPHWCEALAEVARVLEPGGWLFFGEVTATALARPTYRALFEHPAHDRFGAGEFLAELPRHGLEASEAWRTRVGGDYLLGVARRTRI